MSEAAILKVLDLIITALIAGPSFMETASRAEDRIKEAFAKARTENRDELTNAEWSALLDEFRASAEAAVNAPMPDVGKSG